LSLGAVVYVLIDQSAGNVIPFWPQWFHMWLAAHIIMKIEQDKIEIGSLMH